MRRLPDESIKLLKYLALVVNQKFREAHYVHEKNMGDFEMKLRLTLYGHINSGRNIATRILSTSVLAGREQSWQCRTPFAAPRELLRTKFSYTFISKGPP